MKPKNIISQLSSSALCYDPALLDSITILTSTDAHQQHSFSLPLDIPDLRSKVSDVAVKYPYNCVGLVLTFYQHADIPYYGTGWMINS